jgi:hypothetical protein
MTDNTAMHHSPVADLSSAVRRLGRPPRQRWIHLAALAIRARIPIDTLLDQVAQYPTYTEAYLTALEQLAV